jgi:ribonuclease T1
MARFWRHAILFLVCGFGLTSGLGQAFWWGSQPASIPEIRVENLPPEAQRTLLLIKRGGPFPYARDGITFGNREGLLPTQQRNYYREYTVPTPGLNHRGARRIIAGRAGDYWYTADHYRSFKRIREMSREERKSGEAR